MRRRSAGPRGCQRGPAPFKLLLVYILPRRTKPPSRPTTEPAPRGHGDPDRSELAPTTRLVSRWLSSAQLSAASNAEPGEVPRSIALPVGPPPASDNSFSEGKGPVTSARALPEGFEGTSRAASILATQSVLAREPSFKKCRRCGRGQSRSRCRRSRDGSADPGRS